MVDMVLRLLAAATLVAIAWFCPGCDPPAEATPQVPRYRLWSAGTGKWSALELVTLRGSGSVKPSEFRTLDGRTVYACGGPETYEWETGIPP